MSVSLIYFLWKPPPPPPRPLHPKKSSHTWTRYYFWTLLYMKYRRQCQLSFEMIYRVKVPLTCVFPWGYVSEGLSQLRLVLIFPPSLRQAWMPNIGENNLVTATIILKRNGAQYCWERIKKELLLPAMKQKLRQCFGSKGWKHLHIIYISHLISTTIEKFQNKVMLNML